MKTPLPLNLLIVDDHPMLRGGLRQALETDENLHVRWEAGDCATARALFSEHRPDVTMLDVRLPSGSGIDLLEEFRSLRPHAIIIMLSGEALLHDVRRARQLGASAYLLKDQCGQQIAKLVRRIHGGQRLFPALREECQLGRLTSRELEVLQLMARGVFNKDIARLLGTSIHTINTQVRAVLSKLEAADRAEAVGRAYQFGLLKPGE